MSTRLVVANLGHAMPSSAAALPDLRRWLAELRTLAVSIGLLQEMPAAAIWGPPLEAEGWALIVGDGPTYRCRSGIIYRPEDVTLSPESLPTAAYHGSYVVAAALSTATSPGKVTLVSAHASPTRLTATHIDQWPVDSPLGRRDYRDGPIYWDSDYVLATLGLLAARGPVLAAGDFNEARSWDIRHGGDWGQDWFANVTKLGLIDVTYSLWGEERPTSRGYQIDHVIATPNIAGLIREASLVSSPGSDHDAICCDLDL